MEKLLFMDVESGGLDASKHSLLQVGLAVWQDGKIVDCFEVHIQHETYHVTAKAMEVNGILLDDHDKIATPPDMAKEMIIEFVRNHFTERPMVGGHNVGFDLSFMHVLFGGKEEFEKYFSYRSIDTASIFRYLQMAGIIDGYTGSNSLDAIIRFFEIENQEDRHTAMGDACMTGEAYTEMLNLIKA